MIDPSPKSRPRLPQSLTAVTLLALATVYFSLPSTVQAMHITEGILPMPWASFWSLAALPFVIWGVQDLKQRSAAVPHFKPLVGLVGAAVFIISCMPIPVPTAGTCSHPCGTGLAAILIGPPLTVLVTSVALLLQALFLSHGGLTTWGANIFSMGVVGGFVGYGVFKLARRVGLSYLAAAFLAGLCSDWATYASTTLELASALHGDGSFAAMFASIALSFCPTQVPLGIIEGFLSVGALSFVHSRRPEILRLWRPATEGGVR